MKIPVPTAHELHHMQSTKKRRKRKKSGVDFRCHQDNFCKSCTVEEKSVAVNYSSGNF